MGVVTVITPSLNQGRYIERTIQSVLHQSTPNLEYVIVDGGSKDETLSILKRYENYFSWTSEKDSGQANAVNKGIQNTSGEIIGWLNSDDIYYPGTIERVREFFEEHPDVDMVYGKAYNIDQDDQVLGYYPTETWNEKRLLKTCFISQPAVFFRRKILNKIGLLDESLHYCMDYEFWLRMALMGVNVACLPFVLAGSRCYPETKTSLFALEASMEAIGMLKKKVGYVPMDWLLNYAMLSIKKNYSVCFPSVKFVLLSVLLASSLSLKWNGLLQGLLADVMLPKTLFELLRYRKSCSRSKLE